MKISCKADLWKIFIKQVCYFSPFYKLSELVETGYLALEARTSFKHLRHDDVGSVSAKIFVTSIS